jgi:CHAT domain-containing protein
LPGTRREVEDIAHLFSSPVTLFGADASEPRLDELVRSGRLKEFDVVHLATHGVADAAVPMRSALILTEEGLPDAAEAVLAGKPAYTGRLTADRILRTWTLEADLVTLSACESGLGRAAGGEGYVGFAQALFLAGARTVVLSQWKVDDRATALLMTRFYGNLLGKRAGLSGPLPKAVALAEAKRWLRTLSLAEATQRDGSEDDVRPYEHPHYWAGFILAGDPGDVSVSLPEPSREEEREGHQPSGPNLSRWALSIAGLALLVGVALWVYRRRPAAGLSGTTR